MEETLARLYIYTDRDILHDSGTIGLLVVLDILNDLRSLRLNEQQLNEYFRSRMGREYSRCSTETIERILRFILKEFKYDDSLEPQTV